VPERRGRRGRRMVWSGRDRDAKPAPAYFSRRNCDFFFLFFFTETMVAPATRVSFPEDAGSPFRFRILEYGFAPCAGDLIA